jgi:hypothetical protein
MGKYGRHMGISLELNFRTYGKIWRTYGKIWRTHGKKWRTYYRHLAIYDLRHMGISLELNSGKIMADIWELPFETCVCIGNNGDKI